MGKFVWLLLFVCVVAVVSARRNKGRWRNEHSQRPNPRPSSGGFLSPRRKDQRKSNKKNQEATTQATLESQTGTEDKPMELTTTKRPRGQRKGKRKQTLMERNIIEEQSQPRRHVRGAEDNEVKEKKMACKEECKTTAMPDMSHMVPRVVIINQHGSDVSRVEQVAEADVEAEDWETSEETQVSEVEEEQMDDASALDEVEEESMLTLDNIMFAIETAIEAVQANYHEDREPMI